MAPDEEVRRVLAQQRQSWDTRDTALFGQLYAEDGRFSPPEGGDYVGRFAIMHYQDRFLATVRPDRRSCHADGEYTVTITGDAAEAVGEGAVFERFGAGPWRIRGVNRYENRLVRRNGEWLLTAVVVRRVWRPQGDVLLPAD
jgi:uncharacterized protein (TIGR02246 family)